MIFGASRGSIPQQDDVEEAVSLDADSSLTEFIAPADTTLLPDTLAPSDSIAGDTIASESFLDDIITGQNTDSLVYNIKEKMVYIYKEGEINYQNLTLKADFIQVNMESRNVYANGIEDTTLKKMTRPIFLEGDSEYTMDTITYNLKTKKAKIKGISTKEGEGYLLGKSIKKMPDNSFHIAHGKYTTCDKEDCPHFYLEITKGKMIPGKKIIVGPSYLVMEDVPLYFLGLPFGFFPVTNSRASGFIMPTYGEEAVKGFFLRDAGYYFAFSDYMDMSLTGGIYTLGSWDMNVNSRYLKKYRYNGNFAIRYSKDIVGEKGSQDYYNAANYSIAWSHQQDPKFKPNSTFAASVNFSSSGYNKYGAQNMNDYLNTQTNSSISYSKNWDGKPYSFSTNFQHSQNSKDTTVSLSLPNVVFNVSRIFPFQRKNPLGKQRWYEKISMSYTGTLANNVTVKENELFTEDMFKKMNGGVNHSIPLSTSLNLLKYINVSPNATYTERWYWKKIDKEWSHEQNRIINADTTYGFDRLYNYNFSVSATTKLYGMFLMKGKDPALKAVRWVITPQVSFNYTPDFGKSNFGYYNEIQTDSTGTLGYYSPWEGGMYGIPGRSKSASISFSLGNTLEAKVRSKTDTSGMKKISIIDNFSISSSYNLMADSLNLQPFSLSLRTTLYKNFGLNISAVLDPYEVDPVTGQRIDQFMIKRGKLGRIASTGWSFGYSFNSKGDKSAPGAINDINTNAQNQMDANYINSLLADTRNAKIDPMVLRKMMVQQYYDFNIPWNLGFNYSLSYTNNGVRKDIMQTLGFNGSVNLTPKWGITFNGGYDFKTKSLTPGVFTLSRDLHCWQMSFNWVPIGFRKSWSFNIGVKSSMLKDLKYDKTSSFYDNILDN